MTLFRTVGAQHTYRDWLKVAAKTVAKHLHQNQAINIEFLRIHKSIVVHSWHMEWEKFFKEFMKKMFIKMCLVERTEQFLSTFFKEELN